MLGRLATLVLAALLVLALPAGAALGLTDDREAVLSRSDDDDEVALAADDDDDDDSNDKTGKSNGFTSGKNSNDKTGSGHTGVSRDRDRSRGDKTRDFTRDGGDRTRDHSQIRTNDRTRNDTR